MSNFILGAATGYSPDQIETFLNSIHHSKFDGVVALFIHQEQKSMLTDYYQHKNYSFKIDWIVTQIGRKKMRKYRKLARHLLAPIAFLSSTIKKKLIYHLAYPHVSRFFDYYDYLIKQKNVNAVMLADTRDVIIQKNPFKPQLAGLYLGTEDNRTPMKLDEFSKKWICDVYGIDAFNAIKEYDISCAGVTLGDYRSILDYLKTMIDEFLGLSYRLMLKSNYDQGIHNQLLYSGQFENVILCKPQESIISTLGLVPEDEIKINDQGEILNLDGSISAIVHQYDRHDRIDHIIKQKYMK